MAITVRCSNVECGTSHKVPENLSGRRLKCRKCGTILLVSGSTEDIGRNVSNAIHQPDVDFEFAGWEEPARSPSKPQSGRQIPQTSIPDRIARFTIVRRLGIGGFGAVYLARDPQLDREVALKVPRHGTLDDPDVRERFFREAKAAARLQHPHIVPIYDAGEDQEQSYIASGYIEGRTLAEAMKERSLNPRTAAEIVRKLSEALHYAHGLGVIHRDVKPANVMIDVKGEPHLLDFGLARLEHTAAQLTQDGLVLGTPAYMSPEQATGVADRVVPASDQYSLGVVLYQLLTGRTPFDGPPQIVIYNVLNQAIPAPRDLQPAIPRDLETICLKSLARDPSGRYANCQELADDLERWMKDETIHARPAGITERFVRWCRREPVVAALTFAVLAIFAIGFGVSSIQWTRANIAVALETESARKARDSAEAARRVAKDLDQKTVELERQKAELEDANKTARLRTLDAQRAARAERNAAAEAKRQEEKAIAERGQVVKNLYAANIRLASDAWNSGARTQCSNLLDSIVALDDEHGLRDWEWFYLSSLINTEIFKKPLTYHPFGSRISGDWSGDGKQLLVSRMDCGYTLLDAEHGTVLDDQPGRWDPPDNLSRWMLASWSRHGNLVAVGVYGDSSVSVWDVEAKKLAIRFKVSPVQAPPGWLDQSRIDGVTQLAWSHDGDSLLVGIGTNIDLVGVEIWSGSPLRRRQSIELHEELPDRICWNRDSTALLLNGGSQLSSVNLTSQEVTEFQVARPNGGFSAIAASSNADLVAVGDRDGFVRILDAKTGRETAIRRLHSRRVNSLAWSPAGNHLASAGGDNRVVVWPEADGRFCQPICAAVYDTPADVLRWSPSGDRLLISTGGREISVIEPRRPPHGVTLASPGQKIDGSWSRDGVYFATASAGIPGLAAWKADSGLLAWSYGDAAFSNIRSMSWLSSNDTLAVSGRFTGGDISKACLIRLGTTKLETRIPNIDYLKPSFDENEQLVLSRTSSDGERGSFVSVGAWNPENDLVKPIAEIPCSFVNHAETSADGRRLAIVADGIYLVSLAHKTSFTRIEAPTGSRCCLSPDGSQIAVAMSSEGLDPCRIWNVDESRFGTAFRAHPGGTFALSWHPTRPRIATAGADGTVRIWNSITGEELLVLDASDSALSGVAWSPDGIRLAAWGTGMVRIWDASRGYERAGGNVP